MPQIIPGTIAPADGNAGGHDDRARAQTNAGPSESRVSSPHTPMLHRGAQHGAHDSGEPAGAPTSQAIVGAQTYGPNNERLEEAKPKLVAALRDLALQFRQEGLVARRHEIRRIRQARLFWQGLQYLWWSPRDMSWHLPLDGATRGLSSNADAELQQMPRYQFVTNFYQGFGLSFIAVMSQDVPSTRFYPQSAQNEADVAAAKAASEAAKLVEQNNRVQHLLTGIGYYLWTDGKIGGYVRYVADGQRFGFRDEDVIEPAYAKLGEDVFVCPACGAEVPAGGPDSLPDGIGTGRSLQGGFIPGAATQRERDEATGSLRSLQGGAATGASIFAGTLCPRCGAALGEEHFRAAELAPVPRVVETRRVPNGQEVITIVGGLELNTPVWANEMHEYPYLQWQAEVHRAKLKASYPHAADKIQMGGPIEAEDVYARASRVAVAQGLPTTHPGDALYNLVTFSRTWMRPWAFYAVEDSAVREELLQLFPDGCYSAFAGETYLESRNETMDDHWRVMHALPGDGQNRPGVGDSLVQVQERYNVLSNIQAETYEFGIPPIYADPQVLDFDALQNQVAEPAAHYPARAKPGQPLAASFFQPAPAQVPPDMLRHQQDLVGPIAQFLTGMFPAVFGGEVKDVKTATGYAIARDQALGRLGLVWRRLKTFYADLMLLGVDCFRKHRPEDAEIPFLGADGNFESTWIRLADLKGNIQAYPETDETFPRLKSQQRAVVQQLMTSPDPLIQRALSDPANITFLKSVIGLNELVVPGEDSRNKQLREIQRLLASAPIVNGALGEGQGGWREFGSAVTTESRENPSNGSAARSERGESASSGLKPATIPSGPAPSPVVAFTAAQEILLPSVPVDDLLDDHAVEFEECRRWANSDAGQAARVSNPAGFANVRAHAAAHLRALRQTAARVPAV